MADMPALRDIANDTPADAIDVEFNFNTLETHVDTQLINVDGTVAMTAPLLLDAGDPTNDVEAANKGYVDKVLPPGVMMDFAADTLTANMIGDWLIANGQIITTADQPDLYAVIGGTFDLPGDSFGGTQFRVPNTLQKVTVGYDPTGAPFDGVGEAFEGGTAASELILHTHIQDQHLHTQPQHRHDDGTYDVSIDHTHASFFTAYDTAHAHVDGVGGNFVMTGTGGDGPTNIPTAGTGTPYTYSHQSVSGGVTGSGLRFNIIVPTYNVADRQVAGVSGYETATNNNTTPTNQNSGTATAAAEGNYPPYIVMAKIIKT